MELIRELNFNSYRSNNGDLFVFNVRISPTPGTIAHLVNWFVKNFCDLSTKRKMQSTGTIWPLFVQNSEIWLPNWTIWYNLCLIVIHCAVESSAPLTNISNEDLHPKQFQTSVTQNLLNSPDLRWNQWARSKHLTGYWSQMYYNFSKLSPAVQVAHIGLAKTCAVVVPDNWCGYWK